MRIYLSDKVNCIKKFDNSMRIYSENNNFTATKPIQMLVDIYLGGISDFDTMLQVLINECEIEGSLNDVKLIFQNNDQFMSVFTFDRCENNVKIYGEYGKRFPYVLHMELTNSCNLNCPHCYKKANEGIVTFLDIDSLKNNIMDVCRGKTRVIHLTGGEPTLNPDFEKIIEYASNNFYLQLTTNGANLWNIPVSTIRKISDIDISMYGTDRKSYDENVGSAYAYDNFEKTCIHLKESQIAFRINMIVNRKNIDKLDEYILKAISLGATSFSFGLSTKTGRLIEKPNEEWYCDSDMTNYVYRYMRTAEKKYKNKISIVAWNRDVYSHKNNIFNYEYALPCEGSTFSWWMNEKMEFRPCAMIPEEYLLLSYNEWIGYCNNVFNINWKKSYMRFEKYCLEKKINPSDICYVFDRNITDRKA